MDIIKVIATAMLSVAALTNAIVCRLDSEEIALLSAIPVQPGDTLVTIQATQSACGETNKDKG